MTLLNAGCITKMRGGKNTDIIYSNLVQKTITQSNHRASSEVRTSYNIGNFHEYEICFINSNATSHDELKMLPFMSLPSTSTFQNHSLVPPGS